MLTPADVVNHSLLFVMRISSLQNPLAGCFALATLLLIASDVRAADSLPDGVQRVPVTLSGGHETEKVDHGRPVKLIAAALGVKDQVFRDAFSNVHPAQPGSGGPTETEARANKAVLMKALAPYGITNERLDEVSNYYRYRPGGNRLWRHQDATAVALVKDGKVIGYEVTDGGSGYTSPPTVSVPGIQNTPAKVELAYGKDFKTNGSITAITLPKD